MKIMQHKYNCLGGMYGGYAKEERWFQAIWNSLKELAAITFILTGSLAVLVGAHTMATMYVYSLRIY